MWEALLSSWTVPGKLDASPLFLQAPGASTATQTRPGRPPRLDKTTIPGPPQGTPDSRMLTAHKSDTAGFCVQGHARGGDIANSHLAICCQQDVGTWAPPPRPDSCKDRCLRLADSPQAARSIMCHALKTPPPPPPPKKKMEAGHDTFVWPLHGAHLKVSRAAGAGLPEHARVADHCAQSLHDIWAKVGRFNVHSVLCGRANGRVAVRWGRGFLRGGSESFTAGDIRHFSYSVVASLSAEERRGGSSDNSIAIQGRKGAWLCTLRPARMRRGPEYFTSF